MHEHVDRKENLNALLSEHEFHYELFISIFTDQRFDHSSQQRGDKNLGSRLLRKASQVKNLLLNRDQFPSGTAATAEYPVNYTFDDGCFDYVKVEGCGLIRLEGWSLTHEADKIVFPKCFMGEEEVPPLQSFRTYRPDVAAASGSTNHFHGIAILYRLSRNPARATHLKLTLGNNIIFCVMDAFQIIEPHYGSLLDEPQVLHREDIYGFGPPSAEVLNEVICLGQTLPAPILDFGCGSGALVKALRARGLEAYGIEFKREAIKESICPEVIDCITLYDGTLPMPFRDQQFESVTAIEVLEHVPEFEAVLGEIARVAKHHFIVTVPDMSAIPICHHNHVVPWHLLEATHVNFFTQASLERTLRRYFNEVEIARISPTTTNGSKWYDSLVGICHR